MGGRWAERKKLMCRHTAMAMKITITSVDFFLYKMYENREENAREKKPFHHSIIQRKLLKSGIIFFRPCYIPQENRLALSKSTSEKQTKKEHLPNGCLFL